jgi:pSer/pThr/pTyr-binding forkhead associated (FHA) protein
MANPAVVIPCEVPAAPDSGVRPTLKSAGLDSDPPTERTALSHARATLLVLTGKETGRIIAIDDDSVVLGRDGSADIQIEHSTVSRRHARLWREDGRYFVEDLGSANGTAVGSRCIDRCELKPSDLLQLGPHLRLLFDVTAERPDHFVWIDAE